MKTLERFVDPQTLNPGSEGLAPVLYAKYISSLNDAAPAYKEEDDSKI